MTDESLARLIALMEDKGGKVCIIMPVSDPGRMVRVCFSGGWEYDYAVCASCFEAALKGEI